MTMTIDHNQRRFGSLHFEHMSSYSGHPHFTDPWAPSPSTAGPSPASQSGSQQSLYINNHQDGAGLPHLNLAPLPKHPQHSSRAGSSTSMAPYGALQVSAASAGSPSMAGVYRPQDLLPVSQDHLLGVNRLQHQTTSAAYDTSAYTSTASPVNATYTSSSSPYDQLGYAQASMRGSFALGNEDSSRRYSQQSLQQDDRRSFQDALEASHGMLSMSQETPRNIFDVRNRGRGSGDSYGFPPTHSATSSVSSTGFSGYYAGSVDGSVSDYSTAGSDIESLSSRTLPRPQGLMASAPPAPQSMMGSFSSKVSSSTQKKHKCKVCDKRFTRPSSLQTHMYSHTGEKPFACEVEGCGRNFSVVSNLRRHRKVHKNQTQGETPSETGSEEHQSP
ncbi:hypothetical protein N656DRAFT_793691 [Canariomyces notabilis]|uniref:C2H2-type domain-containing protein n=1 Tax=Canariomyces notabilis TaxID=2074819 RepID=A0AAN6YXB2_9PEZI|nr:hypothetical protein N656DRAFT_793691 [Canariomyces arenarius]